MKLLSLAVTEFIVGDGIRHTSQNRGNRQPFFSRFRFTAGSI